MLAEIIAHEMLVPELDSHWFWLIERPIIFVPYVRISGFIIPNPSNSDHVDIPRLENGAIFYSDKSKLPTPTTLNKSPGLFKVP